MDSRDLGMLWSLLDSIQQYPLQQKKRLAEAQAYTHLTSVSVSIWPTPCPSLAYINWFGLAHIHDLLFFLFLCALVVFHPQIYSYLSFIFRRSCLSIFHMYIYNHVTVHHLRTYTIFLSWTSTYHMHSYPQSLSSRLSSLQHAPSSLFLLPALVLPISSQCTVRSYTLSRTILYYRYSYMLS